MRLQSSMRLRVSRSIRKKAMKYLHDYSLSTRAIAGQLDSPSFATAFQLGDDISSEVTYSVCLTIFAVYSFTFGMI